MSTRVLIIEQEQELITELTSGNKEYAATQFVRTYQSFVFAIALRYMNSYDDADDVAQEAFIKALSNIHKFKGKSSLKTWLYRITSNVCKNMLRKRKIMSIFSSGDNDDDYRNIPSGDMTPEQNFENTELEARLMAAINTLPTKQRETFAMRYFDELSYEEISEMLGTSVGGLKANYFQAVRKLANLLKDLKQY